MIKAIIFGALIVFGIIIAILNKVRAKGADKLLEQGDENGALSAYKELFVDSFDNVIDQEGNGHVPSFLAILKKQGTNHLNKINTILEKNGAKIDISPYEELIKDVERFSKQKGVMNYKKVPVKEGKIIFSEFHNRLMSFAENIPNNV